MIWENVRQRILHLLIMISCACHLNRICIHSFIGKIAWEHFFIGKYDLVRGFVFIIRSLWLCNLIQIRSSTCSPIYDSPRHMKKGGASERSDFNQIGGFDILLCCISLFLTLISFQNAKHSTVNKVGDSEGGNQKT